MKTLSIQLTEQQHDLLARIAEADDRRLSDFSLLILAEGLACYFCEKGISVKKRDDEFTEEERAQQAKNNEIRKHPDFQEINFEQMKERGWKPVSDHFSNCRCEPGEDFVENLAKSIRAQACE